jgi:magnesium-transporting ATPase (P-type)
LERERHPVTALTPFDAYLRLMSVTCRFKEGNRTFVKGAPEAVLPRTAANALPASLTKSIDDAAARGDRMLLLASGPEGGSLELLGVVAFQDPPRHDVPAAIAACRRAGIRVIMLTGDHPETARSIAAAVGLGDPGIAVLAGHDIDTMTDPAIRSALSDNTVVARVNPEQKLRIVKALKQAGEIVVVTGDGINDAPALQAADVGVAMGLNGTEVAKQAADIVLADDNFVTIVAGIEEGRSIRANIRRFVSYVFTSNVAEMVPFLVYIFFPVPLPLAVIQALAIDIGTDLLPALTLGIEPPSQDTLTSPPRGPHDPLLSRALAIRTFLFFGVIEALLGMTGFFLFYVHAGWRPGDSFGDFSDIAHKATTLTFLAIVGGQVGCFFAQRDGALRQRFDLRTNGAIKGALAFELVLAVALVYIPGVNSVFSMSPVPAFWLLAVPMGALVFTAADEARRLLAGRAAPKRPLSAVATAD